MSKKVLIVSGAFYPENSPRSFRTTELAKELAKQNHQVTILIPDKKPVHKQFEEKHNVTIKNLGKNRFSPFNIRGQGVTRLFTRVLVRFSNLLLEYPDIQLMWMVKKALKNESDYDLLISIAVPYPIHWGVARSRNEHHRIGDIWVADCGDPYMGQENDTFNKPFYFKFVEKWFFKKTDYISVPTKGSIKGYFPEFHHKMKIIPQGFDFEEIELPSEAIKNEVPTFAYAGLFIPGRRDPTEFLSFLINSNVDFRFYVYTKSPDLVKPFLEKAGKKIILSSYIPRTDLLQKLSKMDFLVNFENIGSKQTPSKLIDYALLKKPILSIKTGDLETVIVSQFLKGNYEGQYIIEDIDQYRIENVCKKFLQLSDT